MSSTNKTTYYELSQYVGTDKPTYLGDYNSDMVAIDTAIHEAAEDASTAVSTANTANATATTASSNATSALSTANTALNTANTASETAGTASTNAAAALTAASAAETAASANTITNLAPAYDPTLTYAVDDLVTYIDEQGSGKLYKCIVAVTTPEAFNINKWDDVTASEAFAVKHKLISSAIADGVKTIGEILTELVSEFDNLKEYIFITAFPDGQTSVFHSTDIFSDHITFTKSDSRITSFNCQTAQVSATNPFYYTTSIDSNGFTHSDNTSSAPANGIEYYLYELMTL